MIRIHQWLTREGKFLLAQLGAPDFATLLRRAVFYIWLYGSTGIVLGGLVAVYNLFGMSAFWLAAAGVILFSMWVIARTGGGGGADPEIYKWMGVTPPGKPQLPPSGTPQIGRASRAVAPSRPGPVADSTSVQPGTDRPGGAALMTWRLFVRSERPGQC
jgi:hypothetical protein